MEFVELLARFTGSVEAADADAFVDLFAADATYEDVYDGVFAGHDEIRGMFETNFHSKARDFVWEYHEPVSNGEIGYAHLTLSYTSSMPHNDGTRAVLTGASQFKVADDRIASYREWAYGLAGLAQLGVPAALIERQAHKEATRILADTDRVTHRLD